MGDPHPKIEAHALTRAFGRAARAVHALGPVDLTVAPGEFTCVVGAGAAWLLDPVWRKVDGDERYAFLGGQPLGEPLGGLLFGPNLLQKDPEARVAPLRAYIRTVNTYFAGDYKTDESFAKELAHLLDTDEEVLLSTPSLRMDREIRAGTLDRLQDAYRAAGVHEGEKVPEPEAVDREL